MIIIDLSVRKRENCLQKIKLNYKFWKLKKKKNYYSKLLFYYNLLFWRGLGRLGQYCL